MFGTVKTLLNFGASAGVTQAVDRIRDAVFESEVAQIVYLAFCPNERVVVTIIIVAGKLIGRVDSCRNAERAPDAQVSHRAIAEQKRVGTAVRGHRGTNDQSSIVNRVGLAGGPAEGADVAH